MSAALHIILASQAAAAEARKSLFERFRVSDATHPTRARTLNDLGIVRTAALDELLGKGVVREASPGEFYLDEPTVAALERAKPMMTQRAVRAIMIVLAVVMLIPLLFLVLMRAAN